MTPSLCTPSSSGRQQMPPLFTSPAGQQSPSLWSGRSGGQQWASLPVPPPICRAGQHTPLLFTISLGQQMPRDILIPASHCGVSMHIPRKQAPEAQSPSNSHFAYLGLSLPAERVDLCDASFEQPMLEGGEPAALHRGLERMLRRHGVHSRCRCPLSGFSLKCLC